MLILNRFQTFFVAAVVAAATIAAAEGPPERNEPWAARPDMHAEVGSRPARVYQDPLFPWEVVIIDSKKGETAWIVGWDYGAIAELSSHNFKLRGDRLFYDQTYRLRSGRTSGRGLLDTLTASSGELVKGCDLRCEGCGVPKFTEGRVRFCGCDECAEVRFTPKLDHDGGRRTEIWLLADDVHGTANGKPIDLYQDPENSDDVVLHAESGCWSVRLAERRALEVDCKSFEQKNRPQLRYRGYRDLHGRVPQIERGSRSKNCPYPYKLEDHKPRFSLKRFRFVACEQWIEISPIDSKSGSSEKASQDD